MKIHTREQVGRQMEEEEKIVYEKKKLFLENHRKFRWKILFIRKRLRQQVELCDFILIKESLGKLTAFEASFVKFVSTGNALLSSVD